MGNSILATSSPPHEQIVNGLRELESGLDSEPTHLVSVKKIASLRILLNAYEQSPRDLDGYLEQYIRPICTLFFRAKRGKTPTAEWGAVSEGLADLVYVLAKVRGYKTVANHLSSDVTLVPRLVRLVNEPEISERPAECYFLLLWLSRLVLVPFPLATVQNDIDLQLYKIALHHLSLHSTASKTQTISSVLLASLLTRRDCVHLFTKYTEGVFVEWPSLQDENVKLGHLMTLNQMLKKAASGPMADLVSEVHSGVILSEIASVRYASPAHIMNTMNALYLLKVCAKTARFFVASGDYPRVASLLNQTTGLMHAMGNLFDTSLRECMANSWAKIVLYISAKAFNYADQVISYMLAQLQVKGLEALEAFSANLTIEETRLSVPRYHTVLLFVGFLAMKRALPMKFLPAIFSITHQTCFVSQRAYTFVQSSQIRDASCFCWWAIFRMLSTAQFSALKGEFPLLAPTVFLDLVQISIFDEDFTMRRCGISVLQEYVGRFGEDFVGDMLDTGDAGEIGAFKIKFVEQFGPTTVGSLGDSHEIIHSLISMGFSPGLFIRPLLDETLASSSAYELQKLGSRHLGRVMLAEDSPSVILPCQVAAKKQVIGTLVSAFHSSCAGSLYALAELEKGGAICPETSGEISSRIENIALHRHSSSSYMGESIMHWLNCAFRHTAGEIRRFSEIVSTVQKLDPPESLVAEFEAFFRTNTLDEAQFSALCRQIRGGNRLLAGAISSADLDSHRFRQICALLCDRSVDADVRATLISKTKTGSLNSADLAVFSHTVTDLLDDYTVSEQGDIGSKVRQECISKIESDIAFFSSFSMAIGHKLLRIAGETIDRLRISAFRVFCLMNGETRYTPNMGLYATDYALYFHDLFEFYTAKCATDTAMSSAFWAGLVHSAGTFTGANAMINQSFQGVLRHLRDPKNTEDALDSLLRLLQVPPKIKVVNLDRRTQKTLQMALNLLVKILDAGVEMPASSSYNVLYVRAYNLHINTTSTARIAPVLRIFQHVCTAASAPVKLVQQCRKRLCWLCCHHENGQVRLMAAEALFEIINETDPAHEVVVLLDSTAWDTEKPDRAVVTQVEAVFVGEG